MVDVLGGVPKPSLLEMIKNFDFQGILNRVMSFNFNWIEIGSCVGLGLLSGFLFKKYFQTFLLCVIIGGGLIIALDYAQFIHIDWAGLQSMFGAQPAQQQMTSLFQSCFEWIKLNVMAVSCFGVGFIVGFKIG